MSKKLPIPKKTLRAFSLDQLIELDRIVRQLIQKAKAEVRRATRKRKIIEERAVDNKTYRLVAIRCGKENCKCATGRGHGPYWYAFWSDHGKTRCEYIGKRLPMDEDGKNSKRRD